MKTLHLIPNAHLNRAAPRKQFPISYGVLFATAVLVCCSKDWRYQYDDQLILDFQQVVRFVVPTLAAYLVATGVRIFLRRSN
jgi:hypothetical protein